jgi:hypothetical protein
MARSATTRLAGEFGGGAVGFWLAGNNGIIGEAYDGRNIILWKEKELTDYIGGGPPEEGELVQRWRMTVMLRNCLTPQEYCPRLLFTAVHP